MSSQPILSRPPTQVPITGPNGSIDAAWVQWFFQVYQAVNMTVTTTTSTATTEPGGAPASSGAN